MLSTWYFVASFWLVMMIFTPHITGYSIDQAATSRDTQSSCSWGGNETTGLSVVCHHVPMSRIQAMFSQRAARDLASFELKIASSETSPIPANILGASRTKSINLSCNKPSTNLMINENAFRSSQSFANSIVIRGCDLKKQPDFAFLGDFKSLNWITILQSKNFNSFKGVQSLPQLESFNIWESQGFENLEYDSKVAKANLKFLYLIRNELNDEEADKVIKIFAESATKSLEVLKMDHNKLTRVPDIVSSFTNLRELRLENNAIKKINNYSLALPFTNPVFLHLAENSISTIEPNAFGDGKYSTIQLQKNKLTRFDSSVFQVVLEHMLKTSGSLLSFENPFECDCHLTWLIVHNRHLMPVIQGAQCSNSTMFNDLKPEGFQDCPAVTDPVAVVEDKKPVVEIKNNDDEIKKPNGVNDGFITSSSCLPYYPFYYPTPHGWRFLPSQMLRGPCVPFVYPIMRFV